MLSLSFAVHLDNHNLQELMCPNGPLFHEWLPDGRTDAIAVPTVDSRNRLELWFERRGYLDGTFVRYDKTRQEVDVDTMRRQGHLDAGQLRGEAQYVSVVSSELEAVRDDRRGASEYVAFGKRVVEFLQPPLSAFIDLLRTQYGQYWLRELRPWDSRSESLGSYCSTTLWLHWREGQDLSWRKFRPTDLSSGMVVQPLPGRACGEYLTESDWRYIQQTFNPNATVPLALRLIGRAHELRDAEHVNEAFVQAVSGVEIAIEHFLATRAQGQAEGVVFFQRFADLPLKTRLSVLATAAALVPQSTLEDALKAIDLRNEIVHEGKQPNDPNRQKFLSLVECAKALLGLDELKTPVLYPGNRLKAPEPKMGPA